ncbi:MAG TPA: hypothetical protein VIJ70_01115 [Gaiellaceae bacterium]
MTLSTPVKIVTLAALALALALGGLLILTTNRRTGTSVPPRIAPAQQPVIRVTANPKPAPQVKPKLVLDPSLPSPLRRALLHNRQVVAVVYSSAIAGDRAALVEARAGAHAAHAGFAALDVRNESVASSVATWMTVHADPAVLVVRRPGTVVFSVAGLADRQTVAQAAGARS